MNKAACIVSDQLTCIMNERSFPHVRKNTRMLKTRSNGKY